MSLGREGYEGKGSLGSEESLRCLMSKEGLRVWGACGICRKGFWERGQAGE